MSAFVTLPATRGVLGAQKSDPSAPGFDPAAVGREAPVHEVSLDSYRIARFPVTVAEFAEFIAGGGYRDDTHWGAGGAGEFETPLDFEAQCEHPRRPVVGVNWFESAAFCAWRGVALPTEAQWEFAARGREGRRFPWGDGEAEFGRLNAIEAGPGHPTSADAYPSGATPEGVLDLAGNVWEWCADRYLPYDAAKPRDGDGLRDSSAADGARVFRGGCFAGRTIFARAAMRSYARPEHRFPRRGFRVVAMIGSGSETQGGR